MFYIYILKSLIDNLWYTGYTNDLQSRFEKHKNGRGAKYTRSHVPERIVFSRKYGTKILAQKKERQIKKLTHGEKIKFIESQNSSG
jgi:putative endonuclease